MSRSGAAAESGPKRPTADHLLALPGLCGVLSAAFLVFATAVGGALREGHDPVRNSIIELYETGAPNAPWLMILFTTYHALVIPFAVGLHRGLPRSHLGWIGPLFDRRLTKPRTCHQGCASSFRVSGHASIAVIVVVSRQL